MRTAEFVGGILNDDDFDAEISQRWGRIRLLNIMLQSRARIVDDDFLRDFKQWVGEWQSRKKRVSPARFSKLNRSTTLTPEDFHWRSAVRPSSSGSTTMLRCLPIRMLWSSYSPIATGPRAAEIQDEYDAISLDLDELSMFRAPFKPAEISDLETRIVDSFEVIRELQLDVSGDPTQEVLPVIRVSPNPGKSIHGLDRGTDPRPRFTTLVDGCSDRQKSLILTGLNEPDAADRLRDLLGLDHYGRDYNGAPIVLGYLCYRLADLDIRKVHRPTPLDDASRWRFKGVFGSSSGAIADVGHTVDLSALDSASVDDAHRNVLGAAEVVVADSKLSSAATGLYFGFLGVLSTPRGDFRAGSGAKKDKVRRLDELFLGHLGYESDETDLRNYFVDGAP